MSREQLLKQLHLRNLPNDGSLVELRARLQEALDEEAMMAGGDDDDAGIGGGGGGPSKRKPAGAADAGASDDDEDDEDFGPKPVAGGEGTVPAKKRRVQQKLRHEKLFLANLPSALMYEKSYMHREALTRLCVTPNTDFLVTGSADGHLKFWKKLRGGIQFVKHFKAHLGPIVDLQTSHDGSRVCTLSSDKSLKVYVRPLLLRFDFVFPFLFSF